MLILMLNFVSIFVSIVNSSPPPESIKCSTGNSNCTITNSYGTFPDRTQCRAGEVAFPTTEDELITIVAAATAAKRKMKAVTRFSHSIPKWGCPDGENGLLISTKYLNRTLKFDLTAMTMTVESGVTLRQLIGEAAKVGLALPHAPYFWGLTVGGLLGTGARGSSFWNRGSCVHNYVVEIRIVSPGGGAAAKVRVLKEGDKDLNSVKVALGVLGVISQVTFKLEPIFKRSITYVTKDDTDLGDQTISFGKEHEFADIKWYPSQRKATYRIDDRVPSNTSGNGQYDFLPFRATPSLALAHTRSAEDTQETYGDIEGKCTAAKFVTSKLATSAYGLTNDGFIFTGYPVIGYHNRLQSSGTCLDSLEDSMITACSWDPRVKGDFFHQTTFSIALTSVKSFVKDVQNLVAMEPNSLCGVELYNGILMRYVKASTAHLSSDEDAVDFDITYYRSKDARTPRLYEDILEEIEQMAMFKYGGLPHWGKNRNLAFVGAIGKYAGAKEFLKVKREYDPMGLFSSEWTDGVLGVKGRVTLEKEGCALEGLCVCSDDIHCAPSKGSLCRPGKVYKEARVCTRVNSMKSL